jgi:hypothetical protein
VSVDSFSGIAVDRQRTQLTSMGRGGLTEHARERIPEHATKDGRSADKKRRYRFKLRGEAAICSTFRPHGDRNDY